MIPKQSEGSNHTIEINGPPVMHTIFFHLGVKKCIDFPSTRWTHTFFDPLVAKICCIVFAKKNNFSFNAKFLTEFILFVNHVFNIFSLKSLKKRVHHIYFDGLPGWKFTIGAVQCHYHRRISGTDWLLVLHRHVYWPSTG